MDVSIVLTVAATILSVTVSETTEASWASINHPRRINTTQNKYKNENSGAVPKLPIIAATDVCNQQHRELPIPRHTQEQKEVEASMETKGINSTWLNVEWRPSGTWTYTNGTQYTRERILNPKDLHSCASLRDYRGLYATDCFTKLDGYVCHLKGCKQCPSGSTCRELSMDSKGCLYLIEERLSWFQSDQNCSQLSGNLLTDIDLITRITIQDKTRMDLWIGIVHGAWYQRSQIISPVSFRLQWTNWRDGLKQKKDRTCAMISAKDGRWETTPCNKSHTFICQSGDNSGKSGGSAVSLTLGLLFVTAVILISCMILYRKRSLLKLPGSRYNRRRTSSGRGVHGNTLKGVQYSTHSDRAMIQISPPTEYEPTNVTYDTYDEVYDTPADVVQPDPPCSSGPVNPVQY